MTDGPRDLFAGFAMAAMWIGGCVSNGEPPSWGMEPLARDAFAVADAMITERNKATGENLLAMRPREKGA